MFDSDYFHEPRSTHSEMRVICKDGLYHVQMVMIYDDTPDEVKLFAVPLTVPRSSIDELKRYVDTLESAFQKPIISV
jgi:hypothetical protein